MASIIIDILNIIEGVILFFFNPAGFIILILLMVFCEYLLAQSIMRDKYRAKFMKMAIRYIEKGESKHESLRLLHKNLKSTVTKGYMSMRRISHKFFLAVNTRIRKNYLMRNVR